MTDKKTCRKLIALGADMMMLLEFTQQFMQSVLNIGLSSSPAYQDSYHKKNF